MEVDTRTVGVGFSLCRRGREKEHEISLLRANVFIPTYYYRVGQRRGQKSRKGGKRGALWPGSIYPFGVLDHETREWEKRMGWNRTAMIYRGLLEREECLLYFVSYVLCKKKEKRRRENGKNEIFGAEDKASLQTTQCNPSFVWLRCPYSWFDAIIRALFHAHFSVNKIISDPSVACSLFSFPFLWPESIDHQPSSRQQGLNGSADRLTMERWRKMLWCLRDLTWISSSSRSHHKSLLLPSF